MRNNKVLGILNDLIETCKDGQEGYRSAAESINNSEFRRLFNIFSQQRTQFVTELQAEVHRLGGEPVNGGSVRGKLRRGWMDVKSVVAGTEESSIIADWQRGEQRGINR